MDFSASASETETKLGTGRIAPPPNYMDRGVQFRLLGLIGALFAVCFAIGKAADPETWDWLFAGERAARSGGLILEPAEIADRDIDTKVPLAAPSGEDEDPSVFRLAAGLPPGPGELPIEEVPEAAPPETDPPPAVVAPPPDPRIPPWPDEGKPKPPAEEPLFPGVKAEFLKAVQDDTVFRNSETPSWNNLLQVLHDTDSAKLRAASLGRVGFAQLFDEASYYRGRIVTLRGTVHRAHWVLTNPNEAGVKGYYICWLRPAGGPAAPIIVYSLELPQGFPTGMDVSAEAEFTGFFFKRHAYAAQDGLRLAPLILAKAPVWTPPIPVKPPEPPSVSWLATLIAIGAAMGVTIAVAAYYWGAQPYVDPQAMEDAAPPKFDDLPK